MKKLLSNLVGHFFVVLFAFISVPGFIKVLGTEAYGIIAFFASLQTMFAILDLGLGTAFIREAAAAEGDAQKSARLSGILSGIERVFFGFFVILVPVSAAASYFLAHSWLKIENVSLLSAAVSGFVYLTATAARVPIASYQGVLRGYKKEIPLNIVVLSAAFCRGPLAVLFLWFVSHEIAAFALFQGAVTFTEFLVVRALSWKHLRRNAAEKSDHDGREVWSIFIRSTAKLSAFSILSVILNHTDKLVVSKVFSARELAYYMVAAQAGALTYMVVGPLFYSMLPSLTTAVGQANRAAIRSVYLGAARILFFLLAPVMAGVGLNAKLFLLLWTRNSDVTNWAARPLTLIICANFFFGLGQWPYAMQVAKRLNRLPFILNGIGVISVPLLGFTLSQYFGMKGVAFAVLVWAACSSIASTVLTHRLVELPELTLPFYRIGIAYTLWALLCFAASKRLSLLLAWRVDRPLGYLDLLLSVIVGGGVYLLGVGAIKAVRRSPRPITELSGVL